jgi:hypothetical protein
MKITASEDTLIGPLSFSNRISDWIAFYFLRLEERINASPPTASHRMGAWEASISPAAQRAIKAMQQQAE